MYGIAAAVVSDKKDTDGNVLNSPQKIIIKKENIGLEEYQHQKYQYNLFNNIVKRDQYYDDLCKTKDRLEKVVPNMQQIIHIDMKRVKTNKVYERKLNRDLTGPRGLNWQFKQQLQRLENNERDVERDLIRINHDLARIALSSPRDRSFSLHQPKESSRSQTPRFSICSGMISTIQTPLKTKYSTRSSCPINTHTLTTINSKRASIATMNSYNEKSPWIRRQITSIVEENSPRRQRHALAINQQKRDVEQKLKQFLL